MREFLANATFSATFSCFSTRMSLSSRTDQHDDEVVDDDVTSFSALDVVELHKGKRVCRVLEGW